MGWQRAEEGMMIDTTLLVHFFGKKGKAELTFDDFYRYRHADELIHPNRAL